MKSNTSQQQKLLRITTMCACFVLCLIAAKAQIVNDAEYFFNTDPGVGNATPISIATPSNDVLVNLSISTTGLVAGSHLLYIRTQDGTGRWSLQESRRIEVLPTIASVEYFFDIDPGVGNATPLSIAENEYEISVAPSILATGLSVGKHVLYIRTSDNRGIWSLCEARDFEIKRKIVDAEYFFDQDPGVGAATPIVINDGENEITKSLFINTSGLNHGKHYLYIRSKSDDGNWSLSEARAFEVKKKIVDAEYFVDIDPGVGNASAISIVDSENEIAKAINLNTSAMTACKHFLYIRTKDVNGAWSLTEARAFEVKKKIVGAEYFVDIDPGVGNATAISIFESENEIAKAINLTTTGMTAGKHILYIRTKDVNGGWSLSEARSFEVKSKIAHAEYFFDIDPGIGNGAGISVDDSEFEINKTVQIPTTCLSQGIHYLYIRTKDNLGRWSLFEPDTITISGISLEICGNLLDDDCDGNVDEECTPIVGDTFAGATGVNISGSAFPTGNCFSGNLVGSSVSPQGTIANVLPAGGQDIWYKIIAPSTALRVVANTSTMNIVLELHDALGVEVDNENNDAGIGGEFMNTSGLTEGATYYIALRSYDGVLGAYNLCVQVLMDSRCSDGNGTYDLCSNFKPIWTGANFYTYNFTPTSPTPGVPTSANYSTQIPLSTVALALRHGGTYDVRIDATFILPEGETLTVLGTDVCSIIIAAHASVEVKSTQRCPAVLLKSAILQGKPYVCGATNFTVEFIRLDACAGAEIGLPLYGTTIGASSQIILSSVAGLMGGGKWYKVRWRPNFAYGSGTYGNPQVIFVGGSAMDESAISENDIAVKNALETSIETSLYPNPNNGHKFNINITNVETDEVHLRIMDSMGKLVYNNKYNVEGSLSTIVVFEQALASGLYLVEFVVGEKIVTEKMVVEK